MLCAVPLHQLNPLDAFEIEWGSGPIVGVLERVSAALGYAQVVYAPAQGGGDTRRFLDRKGNEVELVDQGFRRAEWSARTLVRPLVEDDMSEEVNTSFVDSPGGPSPKLSDIKAKVASLKAKAAIKVSNPKSNPKAGPKVKAVAKEKVERVQSPCRCGCGGTTGGSFCPGHDARFYGWLKKTAAGTMEFKELPKHLQKEFVDIKGLKKALAASKH